MAGSGALASSSSENPSVLEKNVTSPNGTQAGLEILMTKNMVGPLIKSTVKLLQKDQRLG